MKLLDQVREVIRKKIIVRHREHGEIRGNGGLYLVLSLFPYHNLYKL